jgi:hypothetical protein
MRSPDCGIPIAARSPAAKPTTRSPTAVTRPTIS